MERSEQRDEKVDRLVHHSEKALQVGAVAVDVATTMAGLAKVAKAKYGTIGPPNLGRN